MYTHSPPLELFYTPPPIKATLPQSTTKSISYTHNMSIAHSKNASIQKTMHNKNGYNIKHKGSLSSASISPSSSISIPSSVNIAAISDTDTNQQYFKSLPPTPPNAKKKRNNLLKMEEKEYTEHQYEILENYINVDPFKRNMDVGFNKYTLKQAKDYNPNSNKHTVLSSRQLISGYYEWTIKILQCEGSVQEMGIVSNPDIHNINIKHNEGIIETVGFGARAIYGNKLESVYYASYNDNNKQRCYKKLSNKLKTCWGKGDIIKICLDLDKYRISFFLNNKKVRKKISVQPNKTYYPIISFVGDFKYEVK